MGIKTDWVNAILREQFDAQDCWFSSPPYGPKDRVHVIDDLSVGMFSLLSKAETGADVRERLKTRILSYVNPKCCLASYTGLLDEREYTPLNKKVTQEKRAAASARAGRQPWSRAEIDSMKIVISDGPLPDPARIPLTLDVKHDLFRYITDVILSLDLHLFKSRVPDVIIDGARKINHREDINPDYQVPRIGRGKKYLYRYAPGNKIAQEMAPSNIGEGDLKIVAHISRIVREELRKARQPRPAPLSSSPTCDSVEPLPIVLVRTTDTDTIPILLLSMQDWIVRIKDEEDANVPVRIFADLSLPGQNKPVRIIDMVKLWRRIVIFFHDKIPCVRHPIVTLATLMIMTGSDYVENFPGMGPTTVWSYFYELKGYELLYSNQLAPFVRDPGERCIGRFDQAREVALAETNYERFILSMYEDALYKGMASSKTLHFILDGGKTAPTQMAIRAQIRRIHWNIHYWLNGGKGYVLDPFERHPRTRLPLRGWVNYMSHTTNEVKIAIAERVHSDIEDCGVPLPVSF